MPTADKDGNFLLQPFLSLYLPSTERMQQQITLGTDHSVTLSLSLCFSLNPHSRQRWQLFITALPLSLLTFHQTHSTTNNAGNRYRGPCKSLSLSLSLSPSLFGLNPPTAEKDDNFLLQETSRELKSLGLGQRVLNRNKVMGPAEK